MHYIKKTGKRPPKMMYQPKCLRYLVRFRKEAVLVDEMNFFVHKTINNARGRVPASMYQVQHNSIRQDVHRRCADALLWVHIKVFRTSLFVADVEETFPRRHMFYLSMHICENHDNLFF